ncbi:hypothetical protein CLI64_07800 [Nostoc sp. CENA543]|uniref:hypothetical protein n=1 Tax=Nostoc sp. CENA543 TaxID=1869241 RepID=UPI000CA21259|nr:hypothetical protein [Nostoc sp. CENA543]AUT00294.1 hypothetical protein CLI64_07800 [Nostoc sp. CENA543]
MIDFRIYLHSFFSAVAKGEVDIYNEFSIQHEFGCYLRSKLDSTFKIQFERPVSFFNLNKSDFVKKEIDISIFTSDLSKKYAIELKFPRNGNGKFPETMFDSCRDISFLEQLRDRGFTQCNFVIVTDEPGFYKQVSEKIGIYQYFRAGVPIHGSIQKPTGAKDNTLNINGSYPIIWNNVTERIKYAIVEID